MVPVTRALHGSKRRLSVGHGCAPGPSTRPPFVAGSYPRGCGQGTPGRGEVGSDGSLTASHTRLESLDLDTGHSPGSSVEKPANC